MFKMGCSMAKKILAIDGKERNSGGDQAGASTSSLGGGKKGGKDKQLQQLNEPGSAMKSKISSDELNDFSKLEQDPRIPLNVRQIFKITKSWKAIARTMSKTGTAMFLNLFEQNQDLFYLFDRFQHLKGKELHDSMELREHASTVMSTLDQSINSLSDYDNFVTYLHSIGKLHRKVPGFKREHFWKIEQPFLKAVKQTLDERCNETIEEIYKIAIKLIIETISDGYGDDDDMQPQKPSGGTGREGAAGGGLASGGGASGGGSNDSGTDTAGGGYAKNGSQTKQQLAMNNGGGGGGGDGRTTANNNKGGVDVTEEEEACPISNAGDKRDVSGQEFCSSNQQQQQRRRQLYEQDSNQLDQQLTSGGPAVIVLNKGQEQDSTLELQQQQVVSEPSNEQKNNINTHKGERHEHETQPLRETLFVLRELLLVMMEKKKARKGVEDNKLICAKVEREQEEKIGRQTTNLNEALPKQLEASGGFRYINGNNNNNNNNEPAQRTTKTATVTLSSSQDNGLLVSCSLESSSLIRGASLDYHQGDMKSSKATTRMHTTKPKLRATTKDEEGFEAKDSTLELGAANKAARSSRHDQLAADWCNQQEEPNRIKLKRNPCCQSQKQQQQQQRQQRENGFAPTGKQHSAAFPEGEIMQHRFEADPICGIANGGAAAENESIYLESNKAGQSCGQAEACKLTSTYNEFPFILLGNNSAADAYERPEIVDKETELVVSGRFDGGALGAISNESNCKRDESLTLLLPPQTRSQATNLSWCRGPLQAARFQAPTAGYHLKGASVKTSNGCEHDVVDQTISRSNDAAIPGPEEKAGCRTRRAKRRIPIERKILSAGAALLKKKIVWTRLKRVSSSSSSSSSYSPGAPHKCKSSSSAANSTGACQRLDGEVVQKQEKRGPHDIVMQISGEVNGCPVGQKIIGQPQPQEDGQKRTKTQTATIKNNFLLTTDLADLGELIKMLMLTVASHNNKTKTTPHEPQRKLLPPPPPSKILILNHH